MVDFLSQFNKLLWVVEKVKEEGREDRLRGVGSGNDDEVTVVEDDVKRYFLFFCAGFVGLRKRCSQA